ncbi:hypothetical protein HanPSC8_Chr13g0559171 [Helianthus annuus]|nr:hypothetical protein HanPSC8_Chr13g0559171 [Helianthus annuus]
MRFMLKSFMFITGISSTPFLNSISKSPTCFRALNLIPDVLNWATHCIVSFDVGLVCLSLSICVVYTFGIRLLYTNSSKCLGPWAENGTLVGTGKTNLIASMIKESSSFSCSEVFVTAYKDCRT